MVGAGVAHRHWIEVTGGAYAQASPFQNRIEVRMGLRVERGADARADEKPYERIQGGDELARNHDSSYVRRLI